MVAESVASLKLPPITQNHNTQNRLEKDYTYSYLVTFFPFIVCSQCILIIVYISIQNIWNSLSLHVRQLEMKGAFKTYIRDAVINNNIRIIFNF